MSPLNLFCYNGLPAVRSTLKAFMLTPIGAPIPQALQDRGDHILATLSGLRGAGHFDFACRTVRAVRLEDHPPARNGRVCPGGR